MSETFRDTLIASAAELGFGPDEFRPLDDLEGEKIAAAIEQSFGDAANGAMVGWWHSNRLCPLPSASRCFNGSGWKHLAAIAQDETKLVWLLAQNWWRSRARPRLITFASSAGVVQAVLGNTHGFEYIVASREFDWLFAEDHEDCILVAGEEAVKRLESIPAELP